MIATAVHVAVVASPATVYAAERVGAVQRAGEEGADGWCRWLWQVGGHQHIVADLRVWHQPYLQ